MFDKIFIFRRRAKSAFAAASLFRVNRNGRSLNISGFCNRDDDFFIRNQIFNRKFDSGINNFRFSFVAVILSDFLQFVNNHLPKQWFIGQNRFEFGDIFQNYFQFVNNFLTLKSRQTTKL